MGYSIYTSRFAAFDSHPRFFSHLSRLFILVVGSLLLSCTPQPDNDLFASHFEPYKDIISKRGAVDSVSPLLIEAMEHYNQESYEEAIIRFKQIKKDQPENLAVTFYMGVSCLGTEKPIQAISHFREVLKQEDIIFGPHAEWYLALSHLKAHNRSKAISLLEDINQTNPRYRSHSANILTLMPGNQSIIGETASSQGDPM